MQLYEQSTLLGDLERKLQCPDVRASPDEVGRLLADGFLEFGASGSVWTRQQVIEGLPLDQKTQPVYELTRGDFSVHWLADVSLITYRGTRRIPSDGREFDFVRSSIWKLINGQWRMVFHQGTPTRHAT